LKLKVTLKGNKKFWLLVLLFLIIGFAAFFGDTFVTATDTAYCTSCHEMKPELYTWQASSHSQVLQCVGCHAPPGTLKKMKYKLFSVKEWYASLTGNYGILIQATTPIPDQVCNQCHDMTKRTVTPSGDLIIPHTIHAEKSVSCTSCHSGIAHGNIAEKKVTFRTDYGKWDEATGKRFMSDESAVRPDMDTCMSCHKVRKAPLDCSACHSTSMIPEGHEDEVFKMGGHGRIESEELVNCDSCHSYMSTEKVEVTKESGSKYLQFLTKSDEKNTTISVRDYAKSNTFCMDCHKKMPPSHKVQFFEMNHGAYAAQDQELCFTCHDNQVLGDSPVAKLSCGSCHPSSHYKRPWQEKHPVPLPENPVITETCYSCHNQRLCARCHQSPEKTN
jgi:nitrate/TMAO reductase-like tetraheme cytochrome c subunit